MFFTMSQPESTSAMPATSSIAPKTVGMNALVAYLIQPIVPIGSIARFFFGGVASLTGCPDLVLAAGYCLICWLVLLFLHRHRVYVKV